MRRLATWPARRPVAALIAAALLGALAVIAVRRIRPDASLESMMSKDQPAVAAAVRVLGAFPAAEELLVLASVPPDAPPQPAALIAFAKRLEAEIRRSPDASKLCAAINYRAGQQMREFVEQVLAPNGIYYLDREAMTEARHRLTRERMAQAFARNEAMVSTPGPVAAAMAKQFIKDPLRLHEFVLDRLTGGMPFKTYQNGDAFVAADGRAILIRIAGVRPPSDLEFAKRLSSEVAALAARVNSDGFSIDVSGAYAIAAASERAIRHDMIVSVVCSFVFLATLFIGAYRRPFRLFAIRFVPAVVGILYGFGVYALFSTVITPLTAVIGGILAGMGIDYTIHYLAQYQTNRALGMRATAAAEHTVTAIGGALLAAWATSIVGFVAIGSSKVQALRDFALLGSLGLTGAFVGSIFILPAMLALRDRADAGDDQCDLVPTPRLDIGPFIAWIRRRRRASVSACLLVLLTAGVVVAAKGGFLPPESNLAVMHPRPNPPLEAQEKIARRMGGSPGSLFIYLNAKTPTELVDLSHRVRERLSSDAVRRAGVVSTLGLGTLLPDAAIVGERRAELKAEDADRVISDFRAVVAASPFAPAAFEPYLGFLRHVFTDSRPPTIEDLLRYPDVAKDVLPREAVAGQAPPTEALTLAFLDRPLDDAAIRAAAITAIRDALKDLPGATLTGLSVVSHDTQRTIDAELPRLTLLALAIDLAYLVAQLRTLREPLLALLPALFCLIVTLAIAHLAGLRINMINLVAVPLLIGIATDHGVFVVSVARLRRREPPAAFEARLTNSCYAICMCSMTTFLGFGSLAFTSVPAAQSLGIAVGVGVITCLTATFFGLLPLVVPAPVETSTGVDEKVALHA
jgi:predicted RND superfamily exporter protein